MISGQIVGLDVSTDSFILVLGPKLFLPLRNVIGFPSQFSDWRVEYFVRL